MNFDGYGALAKRKFASSKKSEMTELKDADSGDAHFEQSQDIVGGKSAGEGEVTRAWDCLEARLWLDCVKRKSYFLPFLTTQPMIKGRMRSPYILISLVTTLDTGTWQFGQEFLRNVLTVSDELVPEFISNHEPINTPFVSIGKTEALWAPAMIVRGPEGRIDAKSDFLWKSRKQIKLDGHVMHTCISRTGKRKPGHIIIRAGLNKTGVSWPLVFSQICKLCRPTFGMLHIFTEYELVDAEVGSPQSCYQYGPPGWAVESSIPNLAWASFLGDDLAAEVDCERLISHSFAVDSMLNGHLITVTKSLFDVAERFDEFSKRRAELKGLFRPGLFQMN